MSDGCTARATPFSSRATFAVYGRTKSHTFHGRRGTPNNNAMLEARTRTAVNDLVASKQCGMEVYGRKP
ncbi:MAG: hypothetical protein KJ069_07530 [Anaerolineae bacterium]|nr:hypothetical protein [Anaerolineae bacterium]